MKDLWIVASYTIKEMLKKKTFLISNLILIIIMIIGFNVPNFLNAIKDDSKGNGSKMLIIDSQDIEKLKDYQERMNECFDNINSWMLEYEL